MGYSVTVVFRSQKQHAKTLAFLNEHLAPINKLLGEATQYVRGPVADPSYGRGAKYQIGFDFSTSSQPQSRVAYMICYWIAKRVPSTNVWYDGNEKLDIPEECNDDGFHSMARQEEKQVERHPTLRAPFASEIKALKSFDPSVSGELARLTNLWEDVCGS